MLGIENRDGSILWQAGPLRVVEKLIELVQINGDDAMSVSAGSERKPSFSRGNSANNVFISNSDRVSTRKGNLSEALNTLKGFRELGHQASFIGPRDGADDGHGDGDASPASRRSEDADARLKEVDEMLTELETKKSGRAGPALQLAIRALRLAVRDKVAPAMG